MTLRKALFSIFTAVLTIAACSSVAGQVVTGTPIFDSYSGGPFDSVDLGNLNVHFAIPIIQKTGRGMPFDYILAYDGAVWTPTTSSGQKTWTPVFNWGWSAQTAIQVGYISYFKITQNCDAPASQTSTYTIWSKYAYHDPWGGVHPFNGTLEADMTHCDNGNITSLNATASDGSGYSLAATYSTNVITAKNGQVLKPPINLSSGYSSGTYSATDSNGNQITVSNTSSSATFTDTLGQTALTVSGSSPVTFSYTPPSGTPTQYTMNFVQYTVSTNFGFTGVVNEYGRLNNFLVDNITLPDGSQYKFTYEHTSGSCTPLIGSYCVTGRLATVTLPTGGVITYVYSGGPHGTGIFSDGSTATLTRILTNSTTCSGNPCWKYTRANVAGTPGPGSTWTTTIVDPNGNNTVANFGEDANTTLPTYSLYETQRKVYQGNISGNNCSSTNPNNCLLLTTMACYNGNYTNCGSATPTSPISSIDSYSQPAGGTTRGSHTEYNGSFTGSGLVSRDQDYGYGVTMGASLASSNALRDARISYASLGGIYDKPSSVTVYDCSTGTCSQAASTSYKYDETGATPTNNTPQHIAVTGSRGNLTTLTVSTGGSASLSKTFTYYDTGNVEVATDVNGGSTSYTYGACGNSFPTQIKQIQLNLSRSMAWDPNCTGGVVTQVTDENSNSIKADYTQDPAFWRPDYTKDQLQNETTYSYAETATESTMSFNTSVSDFRITVDGFGRPILSQRQQGPGLNEYDTVQTNYNFLGQVSGTTMPFQAAKSTTSSTAPTTAIQYDALGRPTQIKDGSGTVVQTITYNQNDVYIDVVAPSPENHKRKQLEYDGLGRLTSVCEVTGSSNSGVQCSQTNVQTGYWTRYKYNALGRLTGVCQYTTQPVSVDCVQTPSSGQQTRTYSYDMMGRLTSETNPESGSFTYYWDNAPSACSNGYATPGDLGARQDNNTGVYLCYGYDDLHRLLGIGAPQGTNCIGYVYDTATPPSGVTVQNGKGRLIEAYSNSTCNGHNGVVTDEWFSYSPRGETTDSYMSTANSNGYYHLAKQYWPNGAISQISGLPGVPTIYYGGSSGSALDGEGRPTQVTASSGTGPVTCNAPPCVSYNTAGQVTNVVFGSGDSDSYQFDPNTGRMTQYAFAIKGSTVIGNLTWNPNGTLQKLGITDPINGLNNQTCTYTYDDLGRLGGKDTNGYSVNCGSAWAQNFSLDPFGNITKTGSAAWVPGYNGATNQYLTASNCQTSGGIPCYDNDGNLLRDGFHTYQWDAYGHPTEIDGTSNQLTHDAFGNLVEVNSPGWLGQILRDFNGQLLGDSHAQSAGLEWVPLPGGGVVSYDGGVIQNYNHADWLGSTRLSSTPSQTLTQDWSRAPFNETYAVDRLGQNAVDLFTGIGFSVTNDLYDTQYREYHPAQGRWISPDPAGLAAVDPTNPQTWNRYAYVTNNPLSFIDPLGLVGGAGDGDCSAVWDDQGNVTMTCPDPGVPGDSRADGNGTPDQNDPNSGGGGGAGTRIGTPGQNRPSCVTPTSAQSTLISLLSTSASFWGKTIGIGYGGSAGAGNIIGVSGSYSRQLVVSPNGQAAFVTTVINPAALPFNALVSPGAGAYGGFQYSFSNAKTPQDLAGSSLDYGAGGGIGLGVGLDGSLGSGTQGQAIWQTTVSAGGGLGGYGHGVSPTTTYVTPICR